MSLTEHQQWVINIALELETMGWYAAAHVLRRKHFPDLPWDSITKTHGAPTHAGWVALFQIHHGSAPPMTIRA